MKGYKGKKTNRAAKPTTKIALPESAKKKQKRVVAEMKAIASEVQEAITEQKAIDKLDAQIRELESKLNAMTNKQERSNDRLAERADKLMRLCDEVGSEKIGASVENALFDIGGWGWNGYDRKQKEMAKTHAEVIKAVKTIGGVKTLTVEVALKMDGTPMLIDECGNYRGKPAPALVDADKKWRSNIADAREGHRVKIRKGSGVRGKRRPRR